MARVVSTIVPLSHSATIEDLVQTSSNWILGSKHNSFDAKSLEKYGDDSFYVSVEGKNINSLRVNEKGTEIWASRFEQPLKGDDSYVLDLVGKKTSDKFVASVILNYNKSSSGKSRKPKIPLIVNHLIRDLSGGVDGNLVVKSEPYLVTIRDLKIVADFMNGNGKNSLPIVYLSRDNFRSLSVDPQILAKSLAGFAHVFVEPNRDFSFSLKELVRGKNAYLGSVGIYWPDGWFERIPENFSQEVIRQVNSKILDYSKHLSIPLDLTFEGVKSLQLSKKFEVFEEEFARKKELLEEDNKEYLKMLEEERARDQEDFLKDIIEERDELNRRFEEDKKMWRERESELLKKLNQKGGSGGILSSPQIPTLYEEEVQDMVLDSLQNYLINNPSNSRRGDILNSLIKENPPSGKAKKIFSKLKAIFSGNPKGINRSMESAVFGLGFRVDRSGQTHDSLFVAGNDSRKVSISRSSSDHRSGKNNVSEIKKKLL